MIDKFSEILRKTREDKQLSQTDLAARSGLQPSAVSHFETGRRAPSFENLQRLADALSISIDHLTGRITQPSASGPTALKLIEHFEKLSASDQESLVKMAEILAKKNDSKREQ
jgi:transcriptional regulator with XRE-family HTH domain